MNEKRDNSGALFKGKPNDNPKFPGYEGSATIDGVDYWISGWVKEGKSGKFFSLAFKPKTGARTVEKPAPAAEPEDLPF